MNDQAIKNTNLADKAADHAVDQTAAGSSNTDEMLEMLKNKADTLGVKYGPRIGIDSLRDKIREKMEADAAGQAPAPLSELAQKAQLREEIVQEEMKLVRVRIANLNPQKAQLRGEIFTVANKMIGIVKKFVPYGDESEEGYHIPNVIYKQLKERKFQQIKTRIVKGQIQVMTSWVPEFAIDVLDQLTPKEIQRLANAQAAAAGNATED